VVKLKRDRAFGARMSGIPKGIDPKIRKSKKVAGARKRKQQRAPDEPKVKLKEDPASTNIKRVSGTAVNELKKPKK